MEFERVPSEVASVELPSDIAQYCELNSMLDLNHRYELVRAPRLAIFDAETGRILRTELDGSDRRLQFCGQSCHALEQRADGVYVAEVCIPR